MSEFSQRIKVANLGDLKDGTMKEVPFPKSDSETKILLSKVKGQYYATSSKCTHYGAPLAKGVITESGRIVCPWHGACFSATSGDIEDAPGLDSLTKYKVDTEGDAVYVTAPTEADALKATRKPRCSASAAAKSKAGVVIVGGGAAAGHGVEQLRESGYEGPIKILSKEPYMPIDRTKISKALITDSGKIALRGKDFYEDMKADFQLGTEVKSIDFDGSTVRLANGESVPYEHVIVATGSIANKIPVDGSDLGNIFVVRDIEDAQKIDKALGSDENNKKNLVIIGSSFIGMEVAGATAKRANVTVVGMDEAPFEKILGKEIGQGIQKAHEANGVKFILPASLSHLKPSESSPKSVGAVVLKDGKELPCDVCIMAVGVKPATSILKESGISLEEDGGIQVDENLKLKAVKKGNAFAIGDIAHYPDHITGEVTRVEHWNVAGNHARSVAKTISGKPDRYSKVAVFWSAQAGKQLRYAGTGRSKQWEDVIIQGQPSDMKFVAYYHKGDEVVAVASIGNDPIVSHSSELFSLGRMLSASDIKAGKSPLDIALAKL